LACFALDLSEDCADAYVILAGAARSAHEARVPYAAGVRVGERALGANHFNREFWPDTDTQPYMRARLGLAVTLWKLGKRLEAIEHANDLLLLDPDDNQGVRLLLVTWLQTVGDEGPLLYVKQGNSAWAAVEGALQWLAGTRLSAG